jgi:hypothetical protein
MGRDPWLLLLFALALAVALLLAANDVWWPFWIVVAVGLALWVDSGRWGG